MPYSEEFKKRARKDDMQVVYNTSQYQNINSVLCVYYCLYFLHQWSMQKDFYDTLKPFSLTDTMYNDADLSKLFQKYLIILYKR